MRFLNELLPLRLYSNKKKVYMPINEKDRRHGSAIFLMSPSQEENEKMMHAPFLYSPRGLFRSYYIDRNVMAYIDSDAFKTQEEEFDEIKEAALSEGMLHTKKSKVVVKSGSTLDERMIKTFYNGDTINWAVGALGMKECPLDVIEVCFHTSVEDLRKAAGGELVYSFTDEDDVIHLLSYSFYKEDSMDGPYRYYARNELLNCFIRVDNPAINSKIARAVCMALSGQLEWFRQEKNKGEPFKYYQSEKEGISDLYLADIVYQLNQTKGSRGIRRFLYGNFDDLRTIVGNRVIGATRALYHSVYKEDTLLEVKYENDKGEKVPKKCPKCGADVKVFLRGEPVFLCSNKKCEKYFGTVPFHEAKLSSKQRKKIDDSDFGLPDKRKYPMPDASHVKAAIRMFNHCDPSDEAELAKRIKSKMKKYGISTDTVGENNRLYKYIHESVTDDVQYNQTIPGLEYADDGYLFAGNYSPEFYDILTITQDFDKEEFDRISFYSTFKPSKYIEKIIVLKDANDYPMSFMAVYHFPSDPDRAQITTAVGKAYRGHHLCKMMFDKLIESGFAEENGIKKYIWHVHPGNEASEKVAIASGFVKGSDDLDKYGRMTYVYKVDKAEGDFTPPMMTESTKGFIFDESAGFIFTEADGSYDMRLRKYLYRERLKNVREVMAIYDQVKQRNPNIDRTYRSLKLYKGLNIFVDVSYYHAMYLKNALKGNKKALYMYFDFLNRLMDNEEIMKSYKKITYFFPVQFTRNAQTVDDLLVWNKDLNIFSLIVYLVKKDSDALKRWADKEIVFIGDNGYFTVDFNDFTMRKLAKFRRNITRLLSNNPIVDEDEQDSTEEKEDSVKAVTAEMIDKVETRSGIQLKDISSISSIHISHLSYEDTPPILIDKKKDNSQAILILADKSSTVMAALNNEAIKSDKIKTYYKPR